MIYEAPRLPSMSQDQGRIIKSLRSCIRIKRRSRIGRFARSAEKYRCRYSRGALSISLVVVPRFDISNDLAHVGAVAGSPSVVLHNTTRRLHGPPRTGRVAGPRQANLTTPCGASTNISLLNHRRVASRARFPAVDARRSVPRRTTRCYLEFSIATEMTLSFFSFSSFKFTKYLDSRE